MSQHERLTAIHEAGHALAHIRLGILQSKATIVPGDQSAGSVLAEDSAFTEEAAADQIIALCAGYGALQIFGHDDEDSRAGAGSDFEKAEELIDFFDLGNLEEWLQKTVEFVAAPKNKKAIEMLADGLMKHQTLGASYMDILVDYSDGEISESEWEHYVTSILPSRGLCPSTDF